MEDHKDKLGNPLAPKTPGMQGPLQELAPPGRQHAATGIGLRMRINIFRE